MQRRKAYLFTYRFYTVYGLKAPLLKGQWLIIVHAGGEKGIIKCTFDVQITKFVIITMR